MSEIINIPDNAVTIETTAQNNVANALANKAFFDIVRAELFSGSLTESQVQGINALVLACVEYGLTVEKIAYVLATAYHETGLVKRLPNGRRIMTRPMQPVREGEQGAGRKYGTWLTNSNGVKYCPKNGEFNAPVYTKDEYPHLFFGRGFVQLTWYDNYLRAGTKLGVDLLQNPDLALDLAVSCKIIVVGMAEGWFTGRKLEHYFHSQKCDWVGARKIVNGTDKDDLIAGYAKTFFRALNAV